MKNKVINFIKQSPTAYHAVDSIAKRLLAEGYTELFENEKWNLSVGGKYFTVRSGSSIIAFRTPQIKAPFMISATHSDSPAYKVKDSKDKAGYAVITTEKYGGLIMYSWFDRPLSVAGRVVLRTEDGIRTELFDSTGPIGVIPSLAIHLNRSVNDSFAPQATDMQPLMSLAGSSLNELIANSLSVNESDIISHDLILYNAECGISFGSKDEFVLCPRLDDLACVCASLEAFIDADAKSAIPVLAVFDNEEVGSSTKQGAASTFLFDTLSRIIPNSEDYKAALADSFMVSADNAHAKHPNRPEISDPDNAPTLGGGIVIKHNANQRYATDAVSDAIFKTVCERAGVKTQSFYNRPDLLGGSTLGSIADTKVSVPTVDIGIAQLAMHSASETAAVCDLTAMKDALTEFYRTSLKSSGEKILIKSDKI